MSLYDCDTKKKLTPMYIVSFISALGGGEIKREKRREGERE